MRPPERGAFPRAGIRRGRHLFARRACVPVPRGALRTRRCRILRLHPARLPLRGALTIAPMPLHVRAPLRRDRGPARLPVATLQRIALTVRRPRGIAVLTGTWPPLPRPLWILRVAQTLLGSPLPLFLTRPALRPLPRIALAARHPGIPPGRPRTRLLCRPCVPPIPFRLPLLALRTLLRVARAPSGSRVSRVPALSALPRRTLLRIVTAPLRSRLFLLPTPTGRSLPALHALVRVALAAWRLRSIEKGGPIPLRVLVCLRVALSPLCFRGLLALPGIPVVLFVRLGRIIALRPAPRLTPTQRFLQPGLNRHGPGTRVTHLRGHVSAHLPRRSIVPGGNLALRRPRSTQAQDRGAEPKRSHCRHRVPPRTPRGRIGEQDTSVEPHPVECL